MSKTAIQTLEATRGLTDEMKELLQELKELEKKQIIKAFEAGAKLHSACTPDAYYRLAHGEWVV